MSVIKNRTSNFNASEKTHLMRIVASKYAGVIEDKKTDRASSIKKDNAWKAVEIEFNSSSTSSTYRNMTCLKKCYENRKKELRKILAHERREVLLTGGGPPPKIKKEESDDILMSILNEKTLIGLQNRFDDDADHSDIQFLQHGNESVEFEYTAESEELPTHALQETSTEVLPIMPTTSRQSNIDYDVNLDQGNSHNWKKYTPQELKTPMSSKLMINDSKTDLKDTPKIKPSSRRRPTTIVKPLASSDISKKYNLLLDKRLELVDGQLKHMERENALKIKKLELEIEILQHDLAKKKQNM